MMNIGGDLNNPLRLHKSRFSQKSMISVSADTTNSFFNSLKLATNTLFSIFTNFIRFFMILVVAKHLPHVYDLPVLILDKIFTTNHAFGQVAWFWLS